MLLTCLGYCKQCCNEYWVHVSFHTMFFPRCMPRTVITGSYDKSISNFLGYSILFPIVAVPIYFATNNVWGFPFLHTLSDICVCRFFYGNHFDKCEVIIHCTSDLHFSHNYQCWTTSHVPLAIFISSMRNVYLGLLPIFLLACLFSWY